MNIKDMLKKYLKDNLYDGLYGEACGCKIDDLMPCGEAFDDCEAGYFCKCDPETCPADGDCEWHIGPSKD